MKTRTTNKDIKNNYFYIYRIGYCDLHHLLNYESPFAYTCGVYGWNADIYDVDGVAIVTGYRPGVGKSVDYEIVRKYDKKARDIIYNSSIEYDKTKKQVKKLLKKFIDEITKEI